MKKAIILILCLVMVFVICGCSSVQPEEPTPTPEPTEAPTPEPTEESTKAFTVFGEVQDGVYINKLLGVSAAIPEGWKVASEEEMLTMMGLAGELSKLLDLESLFEESAETGTLIFQCSKYALDYTGLNPNIVIGIEDTVWTPDYTKNAIGELEMLYQQMDEAYGWTSIVSVQEDIEILGVVYSYVIIESDIDGTMMYQEQLVTGIQDYSLVFSLTYFEEADMNTISGFLTSIEYQ